MKEFSAQTGGRYTYVDDILNLQDLSLAFGEIFDGCDGFIISGCEISENSISSGFVYLNKKIRHFSGASEITSWPQYIYEDNITEAVSYASGSDHVGRKVYGCAIGNMIPSKPDPLTQKQAIGFRVEATGGPSMKDMFFGKFSLLLEAAGRNQTVNSKVTVAEELNVNKDIIVKGSANLVNGQARFRAYYENGCANIAHVTPDRKIYKISIGDDKKFKFSCNGNMVLEISQDTIISSVILKSAEASFGGITMKAGHIYNDAQATDTATINVNMKGYRGDYSHYRNFNIGNGKGEAVISVKGQNKSVAVTGTITINNQDDLALILKSNLPVSNTNLIKAIAWYDKDSVSIGHMGYTSNEDQIFRIVNTAGGISMHSETTVDIYPAIAEGGQLLSSKYILRTDFNETIKKKANVLDVYSITDADTVFGKKSKGLEQFVTEKNTAKILCEQIHAIYEPDVKDTGWLSLNNGLYIRQYNHTVYIQGSTQILASGNVFKIPESIDVPTHTVMGTFVVKIKGSEPNKTWSIMIAGNDRNAVVYEYQGGRGIATPITITYMV